MKLYELKALYKAKILEYDLALQNGKTRTELLCLYRQLKKLQYQIMQVELWLKKA